VKLARSGKVALPTSPAADPIDDAERREAVPVEKLDLSEVARAIRDLWSSAGPRARSPVPPVARSNSPFGLATRGQKR
jgi:hypothetical protein